MGTKWTGTTIKVLLLFEERFQWINNSNYYDLSSELRLHLGKDLRREKGLL